MDEEWEWELGMLFARRLLRFFVLYVDLAKGGRSVEPHYSHDTR